MRRVLAPADFDWLEPELHKIGALCGGPAAARAEVLTSIHPNSSSSTGGAIHSTKCATIPALSNHDIIMSTVISSEM